MTALPFRPIPAPPAPRAVPGPRTPEPPPAAPRRAAEQAAPELARLVAALAHQAAAELIRAGWSGADLPEAVVARAPSAEQAVEVVLAVRRREGDDPLATARADRVRALKGVARAVYEAAGTKPLKPAALIRRAGQIVNSHSYEVVRELVEWGLLDRSPRGGVCRPDDHAGR